MTTDAWYTQLAERWRAQAAALERYGAPNQAGAVRACADDLVEAGDGWALEALTLAQAAEESGLSYSGLEKMVRDGRLENVGKDGAPRVRRGDLPRKESRPSARLPLRGTGGPPDLAGSILAAREGRA